MPNTLNPDSTPEYWIHLNTKQYGCLVFKWLSHVTWQTIQIPDILDHKQAFLSPVLIPPFEYRNIWQPDTNPTFNIRLHSPVFRWLLYSINIKLEVHSQDYLQQLSPPSLFCRPWSPRWPTSRVRSSEACYGQELLELKCFPRGWCRGAPCRWWTRSSRGSCRSGWTIDASKSCNDRPASTTSPRGLENKI